MGVLKQLDKKASRAAKILIIDIERLAGKAYAFDPKTHYISAGNWIEWPRTVCYAARWYGEKDYIFESEWDDKDSMIRKSWELYDEADIVVTFNGIRFDDKHLRTLWLENGYPPPRPWKSVDLFAIVKQFGFESKSLDSVTKRLGRPGKLSRYDVWETQAAVNGDKEAQESLKVYNVGDIELTEWLYDRLRGWIPNHPFMGVNGEDKVCNQCGSDDLKLQPTRYRAVVVDYALYRCNHCGANIRAGWHARAAGTRGVRS